MAGSSAFFNNVSSTPADFILHEGNYGLTLSATVWGSATLQRVFPSGTVIAVGFPINNDGYQGPLFLPAGNYRLLLAGVTGLNGAVERMAQRVN